jgi:putative transposase
MPWMETGVSQERTKFIVQCELQEESMAELCRRYGVSRKTGYKWRDRWLEEGPAGLADRSRAPKSHPNQVEPELVERILALRDQYRWGPKKLLVLLKRQSRDVVLPAISTIEEILRDHGRIIPRKKRRRVEPQTRPLAHATGPNAVWCVDFKGDFCTGDGVCCYPLTITDGYSRLLLRCQGLKQTGYEAVRPIFEWTFREYGLPRAIRSDNGPPFASRAVAGLSRLSVWWIKLGIVPDRIDAGHPEQNGRHERMHLTLKQDTASPPAGSFRKQQERFESFRRDFNEVRPHEALGMQTPASAYESSPRPYPSSQPQIRYPDGWAVRKVARNGEFYWKHQPVFLSEVLGQELVGLQPLDDRYWRVRFGPMPLGVLDSHRGHMLSARQARRQAPLQPYHSASIADEHPCAALQDAHLQT